MKVLLTVLLSVGILASCNKNSDEQQQPGTTLFEFKITFLDSLTYNDVYYRNADNKLASVHESNKKIGLVLLTTFQYNTDGTLKKATHLPTGGTKPSYTFEFEYNAAKQIVKRYRYDSTELTPASYSTYAYDGAGHLVIDSQYNREISGMKLAYYTNFHYTGNNITESEAWEINNSVPNLRHRVKHEYDNGLNPRKLEVNDYFSGEIASAAFDCPILCENNITARYLAKGNAPYELDYTVVNEYGSNNYPTTVTGTCVTNKKFNYHIEYLVQ